MNEDKKITKEKLRNKASGRYQKKSQGDKLKSETAARKLMEKSFATAKRT